MATAGIDILNVPRVQQMLNIGSFLLLELLQVRLIYRRWQTARVVIVKVIRRIYAMMMKIMVMLMMLIIDIDIDI